MTTSEQQQLAVKLMYVGELRQISPDEFLQEWGESDGQALGAATSL